MRIIQGHFAVKRGSEVHKNYLKNEIYELKETIKRLKLRLAIKETELKRIKEE